MATDEHGKLPYVMKPYHAITKYVDSSILWCPHADGNSDDIRSCLDPEVKQIIRLAASEVRKCRKKMEFQDLVC